MYEDLAAEGLSYGPAFQGVRAAWRRGEETFAEIGTEALGRDLNRFTLHPALLDAALHTLALQDGVGIRLPFTWSGVELYEGGTGADTLRVRLRATSADVASVDIADDRGRPVASVESLVVRSLGEGLVSGVGSGVDGLFGVEWVRA
ncbi:polyketide synthase dehydratase domain-containing protein, partial [Streptomyces sp. NRRL F-5635]